MWKPERAKNNNKFVLGLIVLCWPQIDVTDRVSILYQLVEQMEQ